MTDVCPHCLKKHATIPDSKGLIKLYIHFFKQGYIDFLLTIHGATLNVIKKVWIKRKYEAVGTFLMVFPFVRYSQDRPLKRPLDASTRSFITVLGTKNAGKNEISEYLFSFIFLQFIINTTFTFVFLYKRLQKE